MANVDDVVNWNSYEDYNTSRLNKAERVSKLMNGAQDHNDDWGDAEDCHQTDLPISGGRYQNNESKRNTDENSLNCILHEDLSQVEPTPVVISTIESIFKAFYVLFVDILS